MKNRVLAPNLSDLISSLLFRRPYNQQALVIQARRYAFHLCKEHAKDLVDDFGEDILNSLCRITGRRRSTPRS